MAKEYANSDGKSIIKLNDTYVISGNRLITKTDKLGNRYTSYF
jgi:hypothetical protein